MSPAASENLTWAFQVGFVQVFLFATVAVVAVVLAARRETWTVVAVVAAVAASYSLANGILVWPVLVCLALVVRLGRRPSLLLAIVGALTICSYLWHFDFTTRGNVAHPLGLLRYVAVFLGSALGDVGLGLAEAAGFLGLGLLCLLLFVAWRERHQWSATRLVGAGVALFVLLSAAQTAAGRLQLGLAQAASSRYAAASFVFWLALMIGFLRSVRHLAERRSWLPAAYVGAAAAAAYAIGVMSLPSGASLRSTVAGKEVTVVAHRAGVDDPSGTLTGVPPSPAIAEALRWMQQHELGPWAPGGMVDAARFTLNAGSDASPTCRGGIESVEPVTGGSRLRGWLASPGGRRGSSELAVLDADGVSRGIGFVGTFRPDVKSSGAASSEWTGFVAYVRTGAAEPLTVLLVAQDHRSASCSLLARSDA
jgi:hypothetical protein